MPYNRNTHETYLIHPISMIAISSLDFHLLSCLHIRLRNELLKDSVSTRMQRARLLLLIGTSYMGHDWSADQFIEKHGGEESETLPPFSFRQGNGDLRHMKH